MKYTEERRAKQRERALAANQARWQRENTTIEWDQLIDRLKAILDRIDEKEPR